MLSLDVMIFSWKVIPRQKLSTLKIKPNYRRKMKKETFFLLAGNDDKQVASDCLKKIKFCLQTKDKFAV